MQEQLCRFKADALGADVQNAVLHGFERIRDARNGAAVTLHKVDRVAGGCGAFLDFGNEKICGISNIYCRSVRVSGLFQIVKV